MFQDGSPARPVLVLLLITSTIPMLSGQSAATPSGGTGLNPEEAFERLDANRDGKLTEEEVPESQREFIRTFDRDGDGVLTTGEANFAVKDAIVLQAARDASGFSDRGPHGRFERSAPALGQLLPDLSGYDAQGKELRLADLKGGYAVLVFGCLT